MLILPLERWPAYLPLTLVALLAACGGGDITNPSTDIPSNLYSVHLTNATSNCIGGDARTIDFFVVPQHTGSAYTISGVTENAEPATVLRDTLSFSVAVPVNGGMFRIDGHWTFGPDREAFYGPTSFDVTVGQAHCLFTFATAGSHFPPPSLPPNPPTLPPANSSSAALKSRTTLLSRVATLDVAFATLRDAIQTVGEALAAAPVVCVGPSGAPGWTPRSVEVAGLSVNNYPWGNGFSIAHNDWIYPVIFLWRYDGSAWAQVGRYDFPDLPNKSPFVIYGGTGQFVQNATSVDPNGILTLGGYSFVWTRGPWAPIPTVTFRVNQEGYYAVTVQLLWARPEGALTHDQGLLGSEIVDFNLPTSYLGLPAGSSEVTAGDGGWCYIR